MKRKNISKKLRFEVFKRDSFKCQYCGSSAPDVVLNVDHIKPVSKGGTNSILNLVTSCFDCNSGKSDRELDDASEVSMKKKQLDMLQERRNQIKMIVDWNKGLQSETEMIMEAINDKFKAVSGYELSETGKAGMKKVMKQFSLSEILEAITIQADQYYRYDKDNKVTNASFNYGYDRIGGICYNKRKEQE